jgi:phage shock protein C
MACVGCGESVAAGARFCSVCGRAVTATTTYATMPPPPAQNAVFGSSPAPTRLDGLYRPREGRMVAGVCAGFALRYGWDVSVVRLVLVLSLVFGAGVPFLAYLIAWVVMPQGQYSLPAQVGMGGPGSMRV